MFPSSFGFTCCLDEQVTALVVTVHWGHYQRLISEFKTTDVTEEPRTVWRRHPRERAELARIPACVYSAQPTCPD
jgi:hypothetical protein